MADPEQAGGAGRGHRGGVRRRPLERRLQRRHHARQPHVAHRRRRLARRHRHQPRRHLPRLQGGEPQACCASGAASIVTHVERRRPARQRGPDQLRGLEGRRDRPHEGAREGGRLARHPRQLHRARLHHDRADRRAAGGGARPESSPRRRSRGLATPTTSRVSYGSSSRTTPPTSRARSCRSMAGWGCSVERRRVVVTGIGAVNAVGTGVPDFLQGLREGRPGGAPITQFDASDSPVKIACEVKNFDPTVVPGQEDRAPHRPLLALRRRRRPRGRRPRAARDRARGRPHRHARSARASAG